jgi:hypothetical protein
MKLWGVALAVAAALIWTCPASALISSSQITTPSSTTFVNPDMSGSETVHVAGTVTGGVAGEPMDIRCDMGAHGSPAVGETNLNSDGTTFSAEVDVSAHGGTICHWRAMSRNQGDGSDGSYVNFDGPVVGVSGYDARIGTGPNTGLPYDERQIASEPNAYWVTRSLGGCGLQLNFVIDPWSSGFSPSLLDCTGIRASGTTSNLRVDGVTTWLPTAAEVIGADGPATAGLPPISNVQHTFNAITGQPRVTWTEATGTCQPDPSNCSSFAPGPLTVDVATSSSSQGQVVRQVLVWHNTSASPVAFAADYDFGLWPLSPLYRFPGESSYASHSAGDAITLPAEPRPLYVKSSSSEPDGSLFQVDGGYAVRPTPDSWTFDAANRATLAFARQIPAGGVLRQVFLFAQDTYVNDAETLIDDAAESLIPVVKITSGSTVSGSPARVSGTVSDDPDFGTPRVTVNGVAADVGADGTWSVSVPVIEGANTVTASVAGSDGTPGNPVTRTVTYRPPQTHPSSSPTTFPSTPGTSSDPSIAPFALYGSPHVHGRSVSINLTCPAAGSLVALLSTPGTHERLGTARETVFGRGVVRLVIRLNHRGRVLLARTGRLKARLVVAFLSRQGSRRTARIVVSFHVHHP